MPKQERPEESEPVDRQGNGLAKFSSSLISAPEINRAEMRRAVEKRTATDSESIDKRRIRTERNAYRVEKALEKLQDTENPLTPGEAFQTMNYAQLTGLKTVADACLLTVDVLTRHAEVELEDDAGNPIIDPLTGEPKVGIKRDTTGDLLQDIHDLLVDQFNLTTEIHKQNGIFIGMLHDVGLALNQSAFAATINDENGVPMHVQDKWAPLFEAVMEEAQKKVVSEGRERVKASQAVTQEEIDEIKK
jgi:hypothetical protein